MSRECLGKRKRKIALKMHENVSHFKKFFACGALSAPQAPIFFNFYGDKHKICNFSRLRRKLEFPPDRAATRIYKRWVHDLFGAPILSKVVFIKRKMILYLFFKKCFSYSGVGHSNCQYLSAFF